MPRIISNIEIKTHSLYKKTIVIVKACIQRYFVDTF